MEKKTFDDSFGWLEKFFKAPQSKERREHFWHKFQRDSDEVFCGAVNSWCDKGKGFPSPEELNQAMIGARQAAYEKEKAKEIKNRRPFSQPDYRNTARAREWIQGILDICEGRTTAERLIAKMTDGKINRTNEGRNAKF